MSPDPERPTEVPRPVASDPESLREDIETTRQQLADTVEALSYKVDVKARVRDKTRELREQATDRAHRIREQAVSAAPHSREEALDQARQVARAARERPAILLVGALAVVVALLVLGRPRRKRETHR
jgi:hypothetical protein